MLLRHLIFYLLLLLLSDAPAIGDPVTSHKYPWIARIALNYGDSQSGDVEVICTGSILDRYGVIITARHCIDSKIREETSHRIVYVNRVKISWGSYTIHDCSETTETWDWNDFTQRIRRHEEFDVALLFLKRYDTREMPCGESNLGTLELAEGTNRHPPMDGMVAGFGLTPILRKEHKFLRTINVTRFETAVFLQDIQLTNPRQTSFQGRQGSARFTAIGQGRDVFVQRHCLFDPILPERLRGFVVYGGLCKGDSGGPYMVDHINDGQQLRGVYTHSKGDEAEPCSRAGIAEIFVDINFPGVKDWLLRQFILRYRLLNLTITSSTKIPITCRQL